MIKLLKRHYNAIVKRGLIKEETTLLDFVAKSEEEVLEYSIECYHEYYNNAGKNWKQEAIDLICSVTNALIHHNVDIEKELLKNIETQEKRANEKNNSNKD